MNYEEQGKTISINDLPACDKKDYFLSIVNNPSAMICVVAVQKTSYWIAYIGHPDFNELRDDAKEMSLPAWMASHTHDRQGVIMYGDMLSEKIARILFPDWNKVPYKAMRLEKLPV